MQRTTAFFRSRSHRMVRWLCALAAASALGSNYVALAQFQHLYGSGNAEHGRAVVQVASDGGYMAVGSHTDPVTNVNTGYAVRTDAAGAIIWDRHFYFEPQHSVTFSDVKLCADGNFIITGFETSTQPCAAGCTRMVVMRLFPNGAIRWKRSIGEPSLSYYATSVVETQFGNGTLTNAGDFAVAGYTYDDSRTTEGLLMRLTAEGDIIWKKVYSNPSGNAKFSLHGVDETRIAPNAGDIVATGEIDLSPPKGVEVAVLRVLGLNGEFNVSPRGFAAYGANYSDQGFSITEIRNGAFAGDLVITGASTSRNNGNHFEVLMLETRPDPCDPLGHRADQYLGDNNQGLDGGFCVREITDPALYATAGNVIVTGVATRNFPLPDQAFLVEIQAGTMTAVGSMHAYGGNDVESGFGVAECHSLYGAPGFVVAGKSSSTLPGLYMVRTNAARQTPCDYELFTPGGVSAGFQRQCLSITPATPPADIICGIHIVVTDWENRDCIDLLKPNRGEPKLTLETEDGGEAILYPNPVRSGDPITIDCPADGADHARIVVTDITGRVIATEEIERASGAAQIEVSTTGWAAGSYIIRLTTPSGSRSGRITVQPR